MQHDRYIPLQGASNFRDFGGYVGAGGRRVKWRKLFRSDRLSALTAADFEILASHGIRTVFDLRRGSETRDDATVWQGAAAPEIIHSPLFDDQSGSDTLRRPPGDRTAERSREMMRDIYVRMVTTPGPIAAFQRIFVRLSAPDAWPALFHCAAGKDRTGVTCALVLGVLGVSREDVIEDFMLTKRYFDSSAHLKRRITQAVASTGSEAWTEEALAPIFSVERDYIETALDLVEAAGGAEAFLTHKAGVPAATLQHLRDALLD